MEVGNRPFNGIWITGAMTAGPGNGECETNFSEGSADEPPRRAQGFHQESS